MPSIRVRTYYLKEAFGDVDRLVRNAREALDGVEYDTLIGAGLSGSLMVPLLGRGLGKLWAIARKPNDSSHADHSLEGDLGDRWVFVDDLVDTGSTLRRVQEIVEDTCELHTHTTEYVGAYLYTYDDSDRPYRCPGGECIY